MDTASIILSVLTIVAIIVGPILALRIQRQLDNEREKRNRKLWIFRTLMSFRATGLAPLFVQALNLIDVDFDANNEKEKAVRNAWKVLLDHFGDIGRDGVQANTTETTTRLKTELLMSMAKSLGYDFDEVQIKKGSYYPTGLGSVEEEQHALRRELLEVLDGKRRIPVGVFEEKFPPITLEPKREISATSPDVKRPSGQ